MSAITHITEENYNISSKIITISMYSDGKHFFNIPKLTKEESMAILHHLTCHEGLHPDRQISKSFNITQDGLYNEAQYLETIIEHLEIKSSGAATCSDDL